MNAAIYNSSKNKCKPNRYKTVARSGRESCLHFIFPFLSEGNVYSLVRIATNDNCTVYSNI